jgi:ABC-type transport system involved in multi-copper enzyme maturation permease subunit
MTPTMPDLPMIRLLVAKDWTLFQRQLAAYVAAGIASLALIGTAKPWAFYLGSLLLIVVLVAAACFAISTSLLTERKERTLGFVMSLPVSPLDFYLAKLAANVLTFGVPFALLVAGTLAVVLFTPVPDGLVVYSLLVFGHVMLAHAVSLSAAMAVESEGWNSFVMIASMVLVNPFMMLLSRIPAIHDHVRGDAVVWTAPAIAILAAQVVLSVAVLAATGWVHCRKRAFY